MLKTYKKQLIASSLVILLPSVAALLLWNRLPDSFVSHWAADGTPDGMSEKSFFFLFPLILLALHWLCLFITSKDPKNQNRNKKAIRIVFWIMPLVSLYSSAMVLTAALGYNMNISMFLLIPLGLMFAFIGNYMPKFRQNYTMGIKIRWTLANEENWNLTHRFAGKCWVIGGLVMTLCGFLPDTLAVAVMLVSIVAMVVPPFVYSYLIYRRHRSQGIEYPKPEYFGSKKAAWISLTMVSALLVFVAVLMFTGDLEYQFGEDTFTVEASYYTDLTVAYDSIESVEYREANVPGLRIGGFASGRLLMGLFDNEEFGSYTRYTYCNPEACVILTSGSKTLVLSGETAAETEELYRMLLQKTQ